MTSAASVAVKLDGAILEAGQKTNATATVRDAANNILTGQAVAWSSSDVSIVTITSAGLVTAVTPGTATITATIAGVSGSAAVTVQGAIAA